MALLAALLVGTTVAGPVGASLSTSTGDWTGAASVDSASGGPSIAPEIQTQSTPETDTTTTRISVAENGSAEWQLTIRMALETESDVEEFAAFQDEFEQNRSEYVGQFREQMTGVVENAATATNREMTATEFEGETGVQEAPRRWGYVTYRFSWDGFAQTADGTVTVGDVFRGGYFLEEGDILLIEGPSGDEPNSINPAPDRQRSGELQWNGPASFEDERPEVVFGTGSAATDGNSESPADSSSQLLVIVTGIVVVLLAAGTAYGRMWLTTAGGTESSDRQSSEGAAATTDQATTPDATPANFDELATDGDQVVSLLESEGGRIRQAEIAERLDWSPSKTSRVLSDLAEDETVEKLRIGRQNVIDLADDED